MRKVFGIGFHKTGTTSLAVALNRLGYRVTGPNGVGDPDIAEKLPSLVRSLSEQFDAFQDNPWPLVYREMDFLYPDAKFVLTVRDPKKWIGSQVKHFGLRTTPMRELIYGLEHGCPQGNEEHYMRIMTRHNQEVIRYFEDRPEKLLVMNLEEGDGWPELCGFLGEEIPTKPFPHANTAELRNSPIHRFRKLLKRGRNFVSDLRNMGMGQRR